MLDVKDAYKAQILTELIGFENRIEELPSKLKESTEALTQSANALDKAGQGFRDHIDEYMKAQQESLANNIHLLAQNAIRSTVDMQSTVINRAVKSALGEYEKNRDVNTRETVFLCLITAFVTFAFSVVAFYLLWNPVG